MNRRARLAAWCVWLLPVTAQALSPAPCDESNLCSGGLSCIEGFCVAPCASDASCAAGQACVVGGCYPFAAVPYPKDYGLTASGAQPTCNQDTDCNTTGVRCAGGSCQLLATTGPMATPATCTENTDCPAASGYTCIGGLCTGGSCTGNSGCVNAYPVDGLRCINGRCSSRCTTAATCCASGQTCRFSPQTTCHTNASDPLGGVCAVTLSSARVIALQLANPRADLVRENLVFITEGLLTTGELAVSEAVALRATRWLATHADVMNGLFAADRNVFLVELTDNRSGIGASTLFGRRRGDQNMMVDLPGAGDQQLYQAVNAVTRFVSVTTGVTPAFGAVGNRLKPVALYNTNDGSLRAFSGGSFALVTHDFSRAAPTLNVPPSRFDFYYVVQHEFGHMLAGNMVRDEYANDAPGPTEMPFAGDNLVLRSTLTGCTRCDGTDDSSIIFLSGAPWAPFMNDFSFPATSSSWANVGLYEGAGHAFPRALFRSQEDCVMRQGHGRELFCPACRESLASRKIPAALAGTFRMLDLSRIPAPSAAGFGPIEGVATSAALRKTFYSRFSVLGQVLTVVDTNLLALEGATDVILDAQLGTAPLPQSVLVDEPGGRALMPALNAVNPASGGLVVVDVNGAPALQPFVAIPNMVADPALDAAHRKVFTYRETVSGGVRTGALVTVDLAVSPLAAAFSSPTTVPGGLPRFSARAAIAPASNLAFFPVGRLTPAQPSCNASQCEIWVLDTATGVFLDGSKLTVSTAGAREAGISATAVGSPLPTATFGGELFIAVTSNRVNVWRTADVRAGVLTPSFSFAHTLGAMGSVSAVSYAPAGEDLFIGNLNGELSQFNVNGFGPPRPVPLRGFTPGMQLRDIFTSAVDSTTYVAFGGFFPMPRSGLVAALDSAGNVIYELPVAALGIGRPAIAVDEGRKVMYSNATVLVGDTLGPVISPYRTPLIRGPGM